MSITSSMFYFFEALAALSALGLLLSRNVFYGALLVIVCLLSLAGIYILAFAEFIAITQILIYAGGILVVIIFGIMLTSKISGKPMMVASGNYMAGLLIFCSLFFILGISFSRENFPSSRDFISNNTITPVGINLMTGFVLPFEIAGILLLISLVGASVTATSTKLKNDVPD